MAEFRRFPRLLGERQFSVIRSRNAGRSAPVAEQIVHLIQLDVGSNVRRMAAFGIVSAIIVYI